MEIKMKHIKKLSALLLCLMLVFSSVLPICAADQTEEKPTWALSEDQNTLTYGATVYQRVEIPSGVWFRPYALYTFNGDMDTAFDKYTEVAHPIADLSLDLSDGQPVPLTDVAFLYGSVSAEGLYAVYATDSGKSIINDFNAGKYAQYELGSHYSSSVLNPQTVTRWRNTEPNDTIFAEQLSDASYHYVFGYDATLSMAKVVGVIFELNGTYLYVPGEQCLDIDGYVSLRPGSITVHLLDQEDTEQVKAAISDMKYHDYEDVGEQSEPLDPTLSMIVFLLIASPVMFLLPALLLALGIVMRCVKKIPNRKRWSTVIILSSVWLVGSVITALLLVIPTFFL